MNYEPRANHLTLSLPTLVKNSATVWIIIPEVRFGLFIKGPKCLISPVNRWVALHLSAERKMIRSWEERGKEHDPSIREGKTEIPDKSISNFVNQSGNFRARFLRASSTARVFVTISQYPLPPNSITNFALPAGLCAAVKSTLASRKTRFKIFYPVRKAPLAMLDIKYLTRRRSAG